MGVGIELETQYSYRPRPRSQFYYEARPGQLFYMSEFITPTAYTIIQIAKKIPGQTLRQVGPPIMEQVMKQIEYVLDSEQFDADEWFMFPFEVLRTKKGDCEDHANLVTSLLVACGVTDATTTYGTVVVNENIYRHAWVEVGDIVIESTLHKWDPKVRPNWYKPEFKVAWGYSYQVGIPTGWGFSVDMEAFGYGGYEVNSGNNNDRRKPPKLSREELKKLHEKLEKEAT